MKKMILAAVTGLLLASTAAMAAPAAQTSAQRQTGQYAPSFTQINPTGGN